MDLPKLQTIGERVTWARKRLNWTQEQLADTAGATRPQIQKIENNKTKRPRNMDILAKTLDVPEAWLMFGHSELESLSKEAIELAIKWDSLPSELQAAIAATIEASKK